ncbi:cyclic nucleotide-binding domain-containing protein [Leptolyngbya sp. GGD]|uniref:cyclic nucleotide-binding domain-containing protein n=1 Tax=Leptolyngbya sp. GGD TaxID=2997907 RepID=UPI00227D027E|nr:cyclic nucleotide-binding domain-containing protein [Leptolyngbya sp. GGD]MCY6490319.1 cyclic nucleotide-binding domain-containing protein [Leptolyngbya sp. GGD]
MMIPPKMVNLPEAFTTYIEENFYGRVTEQSKLEAIINDARFLENPLKHVALFSDHGIVHGKDISQKIQQVLCHINGVLIPERTENQLAFLLGYGVMLAYLHDIGMRDFSAFGRAMHPEFAAQLVYTEEFDPLIDQLWQENSGNIAWRLMNLARGEVLQQNPQLVLREMLALSIGHSKSKISIATLNDPQILRATMQECLSTNLHYLYYRQQIAKAETKLAQANDQNLDTEIVEILTQHLDQARKDLIQFLQQSPTQTTNPNLQRYYHNFAQDSFQWLINPSAPLNEFVGDVIDTIRALRCADALRQRGHTFRTSAGYEVLVNQHTANGVYALQSSDGSKLFLLEGKDAISSGEANMTGCELDQDRNLRVSFDRGSFSSPEAVHWAAYSAALVINDIQADVIGSFSRSPETDAAQSVKKPASEMQILVEGVDDNPNFSEAVCRELGRMNPAIASRCRPVASLQKADLAEVERYLAGITPVWSLEDQRQILVEIAKSGQKIDHLDLDQAFQEVKIITIRAGEVLMENGSPASFVYIPMSQGLKVFPDGGYAAALAQPWMSIGDTAAIKGSVRNARVIAERDTKLLMLPKQVYLQSWYNPYTLNEFVHLFEGDGSMLRRRHLLTPIAIQKKQLNKSRRQRFLPLALQLKTLFQDAEQVKPFMTYLEKLDLFKDEPLFQQGDEVDGLYFIEIGQVRLSVKLYGGQCSPVQICSAGELVGEVDFYTQTVYQTTAIATQNSQVYRLTRHALQQMQQEHPSAAIAFSEMILTRIANRVVEFTNRQDPTSSAG